jgi:cysteine synthase A
MRSNPRSRPSSAAASPRRTRSRASGRAFIPANLHTASIDGVIQVEAADAKEWARRSASVEGLLVGISSGATLAAIAQKLPDLAPGSRVLGFNYDTGERYLSVPDFLPEP